MAAAAVLASVSSVAGVLLYAGLLAGVVVLASRWAADAAGSPPDAPSNPAGR